MKTKTKTTPRKKTINLKKEFILTGEEKQKLILLPSLLEPRELTNNEKNFLDKLYEKYCGKIVQGFSKPIYRLIQFDIKEDVLETKDLQLYHKLKVIKSEHEAKHIIINFIYDCNKRPELKSHEALILLYNTLQSNAAFQLIIKTIYELI